MSDRDLSGVARSAKEDLEKAIDRVAARLTHVDEDASLASRIVAALPARNPWLEWLVHSWAPRLAVVLAIIVASGLMVNRTTMPNSEVPREVVAMAPTTSPVSVEPEPDRTTPSERLERLEPLEPVEQMMPLDHEFSLPAIPAAAALNIAAPAPESLTVDGPLTIELLEIADLPLTFESFSPR